jgi:hypothetical protein
MNCSSIFSLLYHISMPVLFPCICDSLVTFKPSDIFSWNLVHHATGSRLNFVLFLFSISKIKMVIVQISDVGKIYATYCRVLKCYMLVYGKSVSQDSSVSKVRGYRLDSQGLNPDWGKRFFSSPQCPDRFWGPTSLLYNRYWGLFHWE